MLNTYKEISRRRIFILVVCYLQIFLYIFRKNSYLQKLKNFLLFQLNQIIEVSSLEELFQNVVFPFLFIVNFLHVLNVSQRLKNKNTKEIPITKG